MAEQHSIPPFPSDIDRVAFGYWLTGFADGESCFRLNMIAGRYGRKTPRSTFKIGLRADDVGILHLIHSYWQCGLVSHYSNARSKIANAKPVAEFAVNKTTDLSIVIAHFERFPLRSKKARDFDLWKQAVALHLTVLKRKFTYRPGRAANRHGGAFPRWTDSEIEQFVSIIAALKDQRVYQAPIITPPKGPTGDVMLPFN